MFAVSFGGSQEREALGELVGCQVEVALRQRDVAAVVARERHQPVVADRGAGLDALVECLGGERELSEGVEDRAEVAERADDARPRRPPAGTARARARRPPGRAGSRHAAGRARRTFEAPSPPSRRRPPRRRRLAAGAPAPRSGSRACTRTGRARRRAAARGSASPARVSQSSAARRLSWSASRRSSQSAWSAPDSSRSAASASRMKWAACRPRPSGSADGSSAAYSRTTSSSRCRPSVDWTMLAETSASSCSTVACGPPTSSIASVVKPPLKIASRPSSRCSARSSSWMLQSIAERIVRWRTGASRAPRASVSRRESSSRSSSPDGSVRNHGAVSSIASGRPSSRLQISRNSAPSGSTRCARGRGPGGEQPAGGVPVERLDVEDLFGGEPKETSARHEHGQARSSIEQLGDLRCAVDEVLEVVEHEQELAVPKLVVQQLAPARGAGLPQPERPGDRRQQELGLGDRGEVDERRSVGEPGAEPVAELDGEPRLADAAGPEQRDEPGCRVEQAAARAPPAQPRGRSSPSEGAAPGRRRARAPASASSAGSWARIRRSSSRSSADGSSPSSSTSSILPFAVTGERVGLPPGPVEGEHQVPAQALAQRVLADELLELGQHLVVPAEPQIRVDSALDAREPQVVETRRLVPRERARREVGQRIAPPQVERAGEEHAREPGVRARERLPPVGQQQLEAGRVELAVLELEPVARRARHEAAGRKRTPNLRDVQAQDACRRRRRVAVPDRLRQSVDGGRPARPQDERGQRRTRTLRAQLDRRAVDDHLELAEHPDFHLRATDSRCPCPGAPLHRPASSSSAPLAAAAVHESTSERSSAPARL